MKVKGVMKSKEVAGLQRRKRIDNGNVNGEGGGEDVTSGRGKEGN